MRAAAPDVSACDRCHAPLAAVLPEDDPAARDGVTCEVCHRLSEWTPSGSGGRLAFDTAEKRMRGTLCDAKAPYFHRVECAPGLAGADLCGACHWLEEPVPSFTSFAEWRHGSAGAGAACQACHMSGPPGLIASGGPRRDHVPDHGPATPGAALAWSVRGQARPGEVRVEVDLRNAAAAHALPAGPPGRALVLRVEVRDAEGALLGAEEQVYRRLLVDAAGVEVPFYEAAREAEDTRLREGELREAAFVLPGPRAGTVRALVSLDLRPLSPAVAARLGLPVPASIAVRAETLALHVRTDLNDRP